MPAFGFTVEPSAFTNLSPGRAVTLIRQLLWAEAGRTGIGRHLIGVPDCINVGDGGVDAYIYDAEPWDDDVIPKGSSVFQIKSADLKPMACRRELHVKGDCYMPLKEELDFRLRQGAAYVLVLMAEITEKQKRARHDAIRGELAELGYTDTQVRVYTADQLAGFANRHPAFIATLRPDLAMCSPYEKWGTFHDVSYPTAFVPDPGRQQMVGQITTILRDRETCPVIRLSGLPGVGKTRSSYEALRFDDLKHQVLYVQRAATLLSSPLVHSLANDPQISAILVVDECDLEQHRTLSNMFAGQGPRLALITMSYEVGHVSMPTLELHAEPLESQTIEEILKVEYPGLPKSSARRLAEFADGYPLIALLLAQQYAEDGASEPYISVSDDRLMNRLIGGSSASDSYEYTITKTVLMLLSLFQRIGVAGIGEREGRWVAKRAEVSWQQFQQVIAKQKKRGIIQGDYYVFVTPFMLRIHLLEEWWQAHGFADEAGLEEFSSGMPDSERPDLLRRFFEHFSLRVGRSTGSPVRKEYAQRRWISLELRISQQ